MKQIERQEYLINCLLEENSMLGGITIPSDSKSQKELLKTLFALREPSGAPIDFIAIQNEYLKEEIDAVSLETPERFTFTTLSPVRIKADALVHFANSSILGSFTPGDDSLDAEVFFHAGIELRLAAADVTQKDRGLLKSGGIRVTPAYCLPYDNIFHAVGPQIKREVTQKDRDDLKSLIYGVLESIEEFGAKSVVITPYTRRFKRFSARESLEIIFAAIKSYPIDEGVKFILALKDEAELEIAKELM